MCDSYYVFRGFARGVSVVNFVFPRRPPSGPALRIRCVNEPSANAPTHEGAFAEGASESVSHGLRRSEPLQAVQECIAGSHFRCIFEMQPASQQRATQHVTQPASQPASLKHNCNGQSVTFRPHLVQRAASPLWSSASQPARRASQPASQLV